MLRWRHVALCVTSVLACLLLYNRKVAPAARRSDHRGTCTSPVPPLHLQELNLVPPTTALQRVQSMEDLCSWYLERDGAALREMFHVDCSRSRSSIPAQMLEKLHSQRKNASLFADQQSIRISNLWVPAESLAFNRARAMRFGAAAQSSLTSRTQSLMLFLDSLSCPTSSDFCDPTSRTMALEKIGYLTGSAHAVAFANMGRLTPTHGVVATTKTSNPLRLSRDDTAGLFSTAHDWFVRAHGAYGEVPGEEAHELPTLTFDLLPAAGASQLHPHLQPHLSRHRYPGKWEATRLAACAYAAVAESSSVMMTRPSDHSYSCSYYSRLIEVHAQLGLTIARTDNFVAFVSLTSAGNGVELAILGSGALVRPSARSSALAAELGGVFHDVVVVGARAALGWTAFSSSCTFPPMLPTTNEATSRRRRGLLEGGMPRYCKIVQRTQAPGSYVEGFGPEGWVMDGVSDISANELYETPVVSTDLFEAASRLRAQISSAPTKGL